MSRIAAIIFMILIAAIIAVNRAEAQTEVVVKVPAADYSFGQRIMFHLEASAPTNITKANLFFRIDGLSETTAISVPIEPGSQIFVDYAYSLARRDVPPFATVSYWWEIHDENGVRHQSEEQLLYYADNRYEWQIIRDQQNGVSWEVFWVQGDVAFGQTALNTAVKALDEIYTELGTPVPGVIRIFVYPSEEDLRSALNLAGYDWAGGQARPELGVILIGIPDGRAAVGDMERSIPHELTHLLVYEASGRTLGKVPPWLNEGLASLNERRPDPNLQTRVEEALEQDRLVPLEALCERFPTNEAEARLAYDHSASLVDYLNEEYGGQIIRDLLTAYANNATCNAGVSQVLNQSLGKLDSTWRAHVAQQAHKDGTLIDGGEWILLWLMTALLAMPLLGIVRHRMVSD